MKFYTLDGWKTHTGSVTGEPWPDTYLHVTECRSGEQWVCPIRGNELLDLTKLVKKWVKAQYGGELVLASGMMPKLDGDYYAKVMMDGRGPESVVCWTGAGFYLKGVGEQ